MKHVVIDIEMNKVPKKSYARKLLAHETVEIGAVMFDEDLQEVSSFKTYVKPEYNDKIEKEITSLTGITTEMVLTAPPFRDAIREFAAWCLNAGDEVVIYSWSESDHRQISKEIRVKNYEMAEEEKPVLEKQWTDFQHEFDTYLGFERKLSLKVALNMAGVDFEGNAHDALDDARNTAVLLKIFRDQELFDRTLRKIKEAMEPTDISVKLGDLIDLSGFVSE